MELPPLDDLPDAEQEIRLCLLCDGPLFEACVQMAIAGRNLRLGRGFAYLSALRVGKEAADRVNEVLTAVFNVLERKLVAGELTCKQL